MSFSQSAEASLGTVQVITTQNRGETPEELAERANG
jgi:hypothetical protein|tara:strand:- start:29 stop:136 length:108 start_codon:yes stop_codon:yes gene_type:complete